MRVILIYDVATEDSKDQQRLGRIRKIARKFLTHVQKSVFEGSISRAKLERLKVELLKEADRKRDSVILYVMDDRTKYDRQILTDVPDPTSNIL